jgi:hypothetical protein
LAIAESLDDAYVDMFEAGGTAARRALGVRGAFRLESPAVAEALAQRANLLAGNVADDVFERLKTVLAEEFYFAGKGPFEVARSLRGEFDWLTKARSELIARTETGAIVSEASWITYSASGVPFKRWLATLDGKEREDHFEAHGQIRAIDEPYDVGGEQLMHPLDPAGSAAQVCNCRCDEVPVVTADQAFSDADVWDGTNNPDQFARERLADPDRPPRQTGPDPSATDDLDFAFPEDEKRVSRYDATDIPVEIEELEKAVGPSRARRVLDWWRGKADRDYVRDDLGRFGETGGGETGGGGAAPSREDVMRAEIRRQQAISERIRAAAEASGRRTPDEAPLLAPVGTPAQPLDVQSPAVQATLDQHEAAIRGNNFETAVAVDSDGNVLFNQPGDKTNISLTPQQTDRLRGATLTHNHPGRVSTSFSLQDIELASRAGVQEIRAVGRDGTVYRMQAGSGVDWPGVERIGYAKNGQIPIVKERLVAEVRAGRMTRAQANSDFNHQVWTDIAPRLGMRYERVAPRRRGR